MDGVFQGGSNACLITEVWYLDSGARRMLIGECNIKYFLNVNKYLEAGC